MDYTKMRAFPKKPENVILSADLADDFLSVLFQISFVIIPLYTRATPK